VLVRLSEKLDRGDEFVEALSSAPEVPRTWKDFLRFVEDQDDLADALEELAKSETERLSFPLVSMLRLQFLLPLVMGVTIFFVTYILPTFIELFRGMDLELPLLTYLLVHGVGLFRSGFSILFGLIMALIFLSLLFSTVRGWFWKLFQYIPGPKSLVRLHSQAKVYQILAAGLEVGAPLSVCFEMASRSSSIGSYRAYLGKLEDSPHGVAEVLSGAGHLFDPGYLWIIRQAEQLEHLPEGLRTASELCQAELSEQSRRLITTVDAVILVLIGILVTCILLSLWIPLYQIIGHMGR